MFRVNILKLCILAWKKKRLKEQLWENIIRLLKIRILNFPYKIYKKYECVKKKSVRMDKAEQRLKFSLKLQLGVVSLKRVKLKRVCCRYHMYFRTKHPQFQHFINEIMLQVKLKSLVVNNDTQSGFGLHEQNFYLPRFCMTPLNKLDIIIMIKI